MRFRVSDEEYAEIREAAARVGLSYGAYIVRTVLAASRGTSPGAHIMLDELLEELQTLAGQVNRIGVNLNQLTKAANATGELHGSLPYALNYLVEVLCRIDAAMVELVRRLP